jgi:hypothetical protein
MIRAACLALLLAAPASAQEWATVEFIARDLADSDPIKAYRAAAAACLAGRGDPAATAALFTDAGWTLTKDSEPGLDAFDSADPNLYVLASADGSFCAAYSEALGTDSAVGNVMTIAGAAGLALDPAQDSDCTILRLAPEVTAEITSSGNDPVCFDETTSSVRFIFGPDQ